MNDILIFKPIYTIVETTPGEIYTFVIGTATNNFSITGITKEEKEGYEIGQELKIVITPAS